MSVYAMPLAACLAFSVWQVVCFGFAFSDFLNVRIPEPFAFVVGVVSDSHADCCRGEMVVKISKLARLSVAFQMISASDNVASPVCCACHG